MNKTDFLILIPCGLVFYFFISEQSIYCALVGTFLNIAVDQFDDDRPSILLFFLDLLLYFLHWWFVVVLNE